MDPGGCNPVTITLFADSSQVLSDTLLASYTWILETDQGVQPPVTTIVDTFDQTYPVFGNYDVSLIVVDVFGCRDTVTRTDYIQIEETTEPNPVLLEYVTVVDKESVELVWEQFPGLQRNFSQYFVHWKNPVTGQFRIIDSLPVISTTSYIHNQNINTEVAPYTYKIQAQNSCKQNSNLINTPEHTTVHLTATPDIDAIQLDWTAYAGWTPTLYQIYEVNSYSLNNLNLVATVPGSQTSFVDTNTFCSDFKSYRITALRGTGNNIRSFSNLDSIRPIHLKPTEGLDVIYASVRADSVIDLAWNAYAGYKPEKYILQKSKDGERWEFLDSLPIDTFSYVDADVMVDDQSYFYRLRVLDECKDLSPFGFYGKSIVLDVELDGKYPQLKWSAYEQWGNGVLAYDIEVFNDDLAAWQFVASTNSNTLTFTDDLSELNQGIYCYRIRAREANGFQANALSNEDCVVFAPYVFTPNAFSPNGDNINDRFIVQAPTLRQASILIFNRWGQKIYESGNLQEGWDGRFKGEAVAEGVYVFLIKGQGEDGTPIDLKGTVTLIR
jgi:gliding motility-associated-like protein